MSLFAEHEMIVLLYRIEVLFSYFVLHGGAVAEHDEQLSVVYSYSATVFEQNL